METLTWAGFVISLFILARWKLGIAMFGGALVLGVFTLPLEEAARAFTEVLVAPGIWFLALAVSLTPLVGAALERTGRMEALIANLPLGRRGFFGIVPAIFGLLPMPGGALLSAPFLSGSEALGPNSGRRSRFGSAIPSSSSTPSPPRSSLPRSSPG
jgi:hypothetical protein